MKRTLVLLLVAGQSLMVICCLYSYHVVEQKQNWSAAKKHCQDRYTDLATVFDPSEVEKLPTDRPPNEPDAWIGLRLGSWKWSRRGIELVDAKIPWSYNEPNDDKGEEICVMIDKHKKFFDENCSVALWSICYNETSNSSQIVKDEKTWHEARKHCRNQSMDLVSGHDQIKNVTGLGGNQRYWVGLHRDPWSWSDKSSSSVDHFYKERNRAKGAEEWCGSVDKSGAWGAHNCLEKKWSICYKDRGILIQKKMTWQDALDYCVEEHDDLASIASLGDQKWMEDKASQAQGDFIWLGLRYSCTLENWFRIGGDIFIPDPVPYKNWKNPPNESDPNLCNYGAAAMETSGAHKWVLKPDWESFNFVCFL